MSKEELLTKALELLEKRKYSELRSELIDMEQLKAIIERTKVGGGELVKLMGTSAWYAPGGAGGGDLRRAGPRYSGAAYKILFR